MSAQPHRRGGNRIRVSKENANITTSDQGGTDREFEEILDLSPPTDVEYILRNVDLEIFLELQDSGSSELSDDAELRWVGEGPLGRSDDTSVLTREYRYGEFSEANLRNKDEVVVFDFAVDPHTFPYRFTEGSHLKLEMLHGTDVTWSNSRIEFEIFRKVNPSGPPQGVNTPGRAPDGR